MATSFPVSGNYTFQDIVNHAKRESINQGLEIYANAVISPTTGSTQIGSVTLVPTECFIATAYAMSVGKGGSTVNLQYYSGPSNASIGEKTHRHYCKDGSLSYPLEEIMTPGSAISGSVRDGDNTTSLMASITMSGYFVTADLNYNAKKVALFIGDSIMRGTTMGSTPYTSYATTLTSTSPMDHFAFQVRNHFQQRGEDLRILIKAMGSYSAREMGYWLKNGWLDVPQADIIFYQLGVNDSTKGTTNQQFTDEMNRLIDWRNRLFPNSKLVLVGPTPLNNTTNETTLAGYRSIQSSLANINNNIYYLDLSNSFDRTVITNYTASDGVHPNIANNISVANTYKTWIDTNNIVI